MAVYTEVTFEEAAALVDSVGLGALQSLAPCRGGIENTNYFVDTAAGRYVVTSSSACAPTNCRSTCS